MLQIRSGDLPADIYLNGERIGSTRDPRAMKLPPGNYDLEIRSSHVVPATVRVLLEPGEVLEKEVVLKAKPATVGSTPVWPATVRFLWMGPRWARLRRWTDGYWFATHPRRTRFELTAQRARVKWPMHSFLWRPSSRRSSD